jgi:hypothetical protein
LSVALPNLALQPHKLLEMLWGPCHPSKVESSMAGVKRFSQLTFPASVQNGYFGNL